MDYHLILEALGLIVIPFVIWLFNIQKEHDKQLDELKEGMTNRAKEGFQTVFKRLDDVKDYSEKHFVPIGEYNIAREYQEKQTEQKIASLFVTLNTQIQGLENKIVDSGKVTAEKFEDIKTMIKELKTNKNGG